MFKFGCLLMLIVVIGVPILAGQFLPWWGTCLVILGEGALLVFVAPKLIAWGIKRFAVGLFKTKSEVLKGAAVHVHSVEPTDKPADPTDAGLLEDGSDEDDGDDEDDEEDDDEEDEPREDLRYVLIDFTVTPMPGASKMQHWEPDELMLVPFDLGNEVKEADDQSATVERMRMIDHSGDETDDFDKIVGPGRFRAVFACPSSLTGRVKFRYYFEGFGDLRLP